MCALDGETPPETAQHLCATRVATTHGRENKPTLGGISMVGKRKERREQNSLALNRMSRCGAIATAVACLLGANPVMAQSLNRVVRFDIRPQTLDKALLEFAHQAHVQIMFSTDIVRHRSVQELSGYFTEQQALLQLLSGSRLTFSESGDTIKIFPSAGHQGATTATDPPKPAQDAGRQTAGGAQSKDQAPSVKSGAQKNDRNGSIALQPVLVTGTHITGGAPESEPIITITSRDIEESGYQTVEQLMDSLPENFNSVGSENTESLASETNSGNIGYGASVDLMGLGFDSTLVLVNGHRLAPTGTSGAFSDVSVIPLDAIQRIDIMTDGASAIYGADAIGGVINYILKADEEGAETAVEYGSVTQGGLKDYQFSQSAGTEWAGGSGFLSYNFHKETPLSTADREFSAPAGTWNLLPGYQQNAVYGTANEEFWGGGRLAGNLFFETRTDHSGAPSGVPPISTVSHSTQESVDADYLVHLGGTFRSDTSVTFGESKSLLSDYFGSSSGQSRLITGDENVSGNAASLPAGRVKVAVGFQIRREEFLSQYTGEFTSEGAISKDRTVSAVYAESRIPLAGSRRQNIIDPILQLDLAARYEHYSDFGQSVNPKLGMAWRPTRAIKVRGTISSSFRAPNFYELYGARYALLVNSIDPESPSGQAVALMLQGSDPRLQPEKSREWTFGVDLNPAWTRGFDANVTYLNIRFRDRIDTPAIPFPNALASDTPYISSVQQNPSLGELNGFIQAPVQYYNITTYPGLGPPAELAQSVAVVNDELQNIGLTTVDAVQLRTKYESSVVGVTYRVNSNISYLLKYENSFGDGSQPVSILNTLENPLGLRGRIGLSAAKGRWSFSGAVNYSNRYTDNIAVPSVGVASWTTIDGQLDYRLSEESLYGAKLQLALSCQNCADRQPPRVSPSSYLFGYDPTNASPLGRFVSVTLRGNW